MTTFAYGLITGILFGFLLQKGRVLRYDKQIGALRLLDMTIVKFMFSSVLVGMIGVYLLKDLGAYLGHLFQAAPGRKRGQFRKGRPGAAAAESAARQPACQV